MPDPKAKVHAVVWHAPAASVPDELVAALSRQGVEWTDARGPLQAFAELLGARRDGRGSRVLLLVEPPSLTDAEEVRRALQRFDPSVRCWAFAAAASPRLTPIPPPTPLREQEIHVRPMGRGTVAPGLKLAGEGPTRETPVDTEQNADFPPHLRQPEAGESTLSRSPRSLLTPEELDMLLADDR